LNFGFVSDFKIRISDLAQKPGDSLTEWHSPVTLKKPLHGADVDPVPRIIFSIASRP
jgi:hypothetical protein